MSDDNEQESNTGKGATILPFTPRERAEEVEAGEENAVVGSYACECGSTNLTLYADGLVQCSECLMYASNLIVMEGEIDVEFPEDNTDE
jgi:hypothetical protein